MTGDKTNGEKGCWEMCYFPTPIMLIPNGSWDKSKTLYPLRNCILPKEATAGAPATTQSAALWFLDPHSCLIGNYAISQWVWVLPIKRDQCWPASARFGANVKC